MYFLLVLEVGKSKIKFPAGLKSKIKFPAAFSFRWELPYWLIDSTWSSHGLSSECGRERKNERQREDEIEIEWGVERKREWERERWGSLRERGRETSSLVSFLIKTLIIKGQGPILRISPNLSHLLIDSTSKYIGVSHIGVYCFNIWIWGNTIWSTADADRWQETSVVRNNLITHSTAGSMSFLFSSLSLMSHWT